MTTKSYGTDCTALALPAANWQEQTSDVVGYRHAGQLHRAAGYHHATAQTGTVTSRERCSRVLNLNSHFHRLFLTAGVRTPGGRPCH